MIEIITFTLLGMLTVCAGCFALFIVLEFIAYIILYGKDDYNE